MLAVNDIHATPSLTYLFRILDLRGNGYLDEMTLSYFVKVGYLNDIKLLDFTGDHFVDLHVRILYT